MTNQQIHQELIDLTKDLIRIPSTGSRPDDIHRCADFITGWLRENEIAFEKVTHNRIPSILVLPEERKSQVLLMTHFDVVEVDDPAQFNPYEQNGRLYGRGSADDKYGVALSLLLFREHLRHLKAAGKSQRDICFGLLLTGDEEAGGADGAGKIAQTLETDFFIALDGGHPGHIVTKEKGILALNLSAKGTAAHAARPWLGQSAFDILVDDYQKIKKLFQEERHDRWHKTVVLANCRCGNGSTNIVPEHATATLDIRYTENDNPDQLLETIKGLTESEVTLKAMEPVFESGPSPYLDLLVTHAGGADVGFEHGASDARYLSRRNIPGAIWGADGEKSAHTKIEHVVISSIYKIYDSLDEYLKAIQKNGQIK